MLLLKIGEVKPLHPEPFIGHTGLFIEPFTSRQQRALEDTLWTEIAAEERIGDDYS
jgi:hypothetical protein